MDYCRECSDHALTAYKGLFDLPVGLNWTQGVCDIEASELELQFLIKAPEQSNGDYDLELQVRNSNQPILSVEVRAESNQNGYEKLERTKQFTFIRAGAEGEGKGKGLKREPLRVRMNSVIGTTRTFQNVWVGTNYYGKNFYNVPPTK